MFSFRDLPIRQKLMVFILLVSGSVMLAAVFSIVAFERSIFRHRVLRDLDVRALMIGASTEPALDFNQPKLAQDVLNTLSSSHEILSACVYGKDGRLVASYARPEVPRVFPAPQADSHQFHDHELDLFHRIVSNDESIGTVYLKCDLTQSATPARYDAMIGAIIIMGLVGLAFALSIALQRTISTPIMRLAATAKAIPAKGDYSLRANKESNDEIGQLTDAFNQMLVIIAAREQALKQANEDLKGELAERKQAEAALHESQRQLQDLNAQLESRVAERTAKLQETVSDLEHFSHSITHDMRAPLRAMTNFAAFLEEECVGCLKPESLDYFRRIKEAASRMDKLIQDSLSYSRIVRQGMPLQPVELTQLLHSLIESYPNLQPPQSQIKIEPDKLMVLGNEAGLTQCFANLLGNAVKFVAPGVKPRIRIWAEASQNAEHRVRIWVEDNGIGIPLQGRHHLFGMFQRLNNQYEGTGIGLAIVKKVVERMGGKVGVESQPGDGSRFWVELQQPSEPS